MQTIERARAYLSRLPLAIASQGGHSATLYAACRLVEFGLAWEAAWPLLVEWNQTHCQPLWSESELVHKLQDAFKRAKPSEKFIARMVGRGEGFKGQCRAPGQGVARPERTAVRSYHLNRPDAVPVGAVSPNMASQSPAPCPPRTLESIAMTEGTHAQLDSLATLRGLEIEAVTLASERGLLRFGRYRSKAAWFVLDSHRKAISARRMDGFPWWAEGSPGYGVKALCVRGSQASWPIGIMEALPFPSVALCEGGPDLLACCHFLIAQKKAETCAPVAMLSASALIHLEALPLFHDKRVRIFADNDKAGQEAVTRWTCQLTKAGATVDAFSLAGLTKANGQPVKDLNDLAHVAPDTFNRFTCLQNLFP